MQKIATCLWFDGNAEEAVKFYTGIFPDSRIRETMLHGEAGPGPAENVLALTFDLLGAEYIALNGGPDFSFTPAISIFVKCETQDEIDRYWDKLLEGGSPMACGWLTDRFGVSWQIAPGKLMGMLQDEDPVKAARTMRMMRTMIKLDIAALEKAYRGE